MSNNTLCRVAQEVSYDLLLKYLPKDFIEKQNIRLLNEKPSPNYSIVERHNLPKPIIQRLKNYFYRHRVQQDLLDIEEDTLRYWTTKEKCVAEAFIQEIIDDYRQKIENESCIQVFGHGVQCIFVKGGRLFILSLTLIYQGYRLGIPLLAQIRFRRSYLINKYLINNIYLITSIGIFETYMNYDNNITGMIYFESTRLALEAVEKLNQNDRNNNFRVERRNLKDSFVTCNIQINFYLAQGTGSGLIVFDKSEDGQDGAEKLAIQSIMTPIHVNGEQIQLFLSQTQENQIRVNGTSMLQKIALDRYVDEKQLEQVISAYCEQYGLTEKPIFYLIFREDVEEKYQTEDQEMWQIIFNNHDRKDQIMELLKPLQNKNNLIYLFKKLNQHKNLKVQNKISVDIRKNQDFLGVAKLFQMYNNKLNILGEQKCHFNVQYEHYKPFQSRQYHHLEEQFIQAKDKTKENNPDVGIAYFDGTQYGSMAIRITSNNPLKVIQVANFFSPLINGRRFPQIQGFTTLMDNHAFREILVMIQREQNCYIDRLGERNSKIYGRSFDCIKSCLKAINVFIEEKKFRSSDVEKIIDLRGLCLKPFLVYQDNFLTFLQQEFPMVEFQFDLIIKQLVLFGGPDQIEEIQTILYRDLKKQVYKFVESPIECSICMDNQSAVIQYGFIVYSKNCADCLIRYALDQIENNSLPLKCPTCNEHVSISDIKSIVGDDTFQDLLYKSYKAYTSNNGDKYVQCVTPDCDQIFLKDENTMFMHCECCLNQFCCQCKQGAHEKQTCAEYSLNLKKQEILTDAMRDKFDIKKCPKCKSDIQKNLGCDHIECKQCKVHFCWICLEQADNKDTIYKHIIAVHHGGR